MKRIVLAILMIAGLCEAVTAQDLPPEILVDQYMMEAQQTLADTTIRWNARHNAAVKAFSKIEGLKVEPPLEYYYFYGKTLVDAAEGGEYSGVAKKEYQCSSNTSLKPGKMPFTIRPPWDCLRRNRNINGTS